MKHNNNNKSFSLFSSIILLCFALIGQCNANKHNHHANPPEGSHHSFSDTPGSHDDDFGSSPAPAPGPSSHGHFSSSFSDLLKGTEHASNSQNEHNKELKQICSHTDYPDVCLSTVPSYIKDHEFNVTSVLQAAIKACSKKIKISMDKMKKVPSKVPSEDTGASLVSDCKQHYRMAHDNLKKAKEAILSNDLATVTITLSAAVADVSACESGFRDLKKSPYNPDSHGLIGMMAHNCLAIAHTIPH